MSELRWTLDGGDFLVEDGSGWRSATEAEISGAATGTYSDAWRSGLGLRLGRLMLFPFVRLAGALPDGVVAELVVRRGPAVLEVAHPVAMGIVEGTRWHPLDRERTEQCLRFLDKHSLVPGGRLTLGRYLEIKADPSGCDVVVDQTDPEAEPASWTPAEPVDTEGLGIELFPYQQTGLTLLSALSSRDVGALLADEMGLGKTAQAIALVLDQRNGGSSLVVAPASLMANWRRELALVAPALTVIEHRGALRTGVAAGLEGVDVVLTSYETLVADLSFISDIGWNLVVLDEAQLIRNPDARRSAATKELRRRVSLAVTGTPLENRLLDVWSIAEFVVPSLLGARQGFEVAYPDDVERARALGGVLNPITLRRSVREVARDLPDLVQDEYAFELSPQDRDRYAHLSQAAASALAATTQLRVLCAHADDTGWDPQGVLPAKVEHALRQIAEVFDRGQKVLLFASFQRALDRMYDAVLARHPEAFLAVIDGRQEPVSRQAVIDRFAEFPGVGALFLNPQAAGVGLNITAANHVIHFNPEWNPALTSQATARAYRRKQELPVAVHHLYYAGTVEEDALLLAGWKRELAEGLAEGAAAMMNGGKDDETT